MSGATNKSFRYWLRRAGLAIPDATDSAGATDAAPHITPALVPLSASPHCIRLLDTGIELTAA